ncbi:MAG: hypothetical protein M1819_004961 [Sarea resinae]|nr:MAG: hypothetical protein M1819_004961 [Sarea resinae]
MESTVDNGVCQYGYDMFRPPVNRAMRVLDRSFFKKRVPLSAARIPDNKKISKIRTELDRSQDLLRQPRITMKDSSTWGPKVEGLVKAGDAGLIPFDVDLDYEYWTYHDIMSAILPEDEQDELPTGFSIVGHVAHFNLREQYLPYKSLIATVLLDKTPTVRTVINKTDDVGTHSEFRTFAFEILAGPSDLNVEVKEADCFFRFDYSKVYWNPRLNTEHRRLVDMFREGEAVCDVMAGVGPFAVPAGKKGVFVWANDLNPESFASLEDAITRNKVAPFVRAFNQDGHTFIRESAAALLNTAHTVTLPPAKQPRHQHQPQSQPANSSTTPTASESQQTPSPSPSSAAPASRALTLPRTFSHYVLNLPASALTFLPSFISLYPPSSRPLFHPHTARKLPMLHVHTFAIKRDDDGNAEARGQICREIERQFGWREGCIEFATGLADLRTMGKNGKGGEQGEGEGEGEEGKVDLEMTVWDVRDVAPLKRMFCVSFRLPAEVAFRDASS